MNCLKTAAIKDYDILTNSLDVRLGIFGISKFSETSGEFAQRNGMAGIQAQ